MSVGNVSEGKILWPDGKDFAFTIFDDPDLETLENGRPVYDLLAEYGFRTTKGVWPCAPGDDVDHEANPLADYVIDGDTLDRPDYLDWMLKLQDLGFEAGLHNATYLTSRRDFIRRALDVYQVRLGQHPRTYATHFQCRDGMYWGSGRISGFNRFAYNVLNRYRTEGLFQGHKEGSEFFWGDLCRERVDYLRNFVFPDINTLKMCPEMPYYDPDREYAKGWFASSEGPDLHGFNRTLCEANQDQLEEERGACIMYTHFGKGFSDGKQVDPTFRRLIERLSRKNGWFVPVSTLLDHLKDQKGLKVLSRSERAVLERRWIVSKIMSGGTS